MYTRDTEQLPKPGSKGDTTAWLIDKTINKIVLHNRGQGAKSFNEVGRRTWYSCATGSKREGL